MFELADEAYAVKDALEDLKQLATGEIGSNNEDAVAGFLWSANQTDEGFYEYKSFLCRFLRNNRS